MKYPFVPKSTSYLEEGQIISIPLSNGKFACGRVLELKYEGTKRDTRQFIVGLMAWCDKEPPNSETISGSTILDHGQVHIKTIKECDSQIVGYRNLADDRIQVPLSLDQSPGKNCRLRRGYSLLGLASENEQTKLEVFSTWGFKVLKIKAEKHYGNKNV